MSRYHVTLNEREAREAFTEWVQEHLFPNRSIGEVVYFNQDLLTGMVTVELSQPIPLDDDFEGAAV
jgi:hypothetical protein